MFHIVLFEPRIPQNTGNIARTCAVTGTALHLIKPYAFNITDRSLKRAGLTYWNILNFNEYSDFNDFLLKNVNKRKFLITSKGNKIYSDIKFKNDDMFIFGREDIGVTDEIYHYFNDFKLKIPMINHREARCINLSTSVGIVLYEALRQEGFISIK